MANETIFKNGLKTTALKVGNYSFPSLVGTTAQILSVDGSGNLVFADNAAGGINNVVEDTTPQLGGSLDVQSNSIFTNVLNGDITLSPNGTGSVDVSSKKITNLATPTASTDAATMGYVDTGLADKLDSSVASTTYLALAGGLMTTDANITFSGTGEVLGLPNTPSVDGAATSKKYVDTGLSTKLDLAGGSMDTDASITFSGTGEVLGLPTVPSVDDAATSKKYVDDQVATKLSNVVEDTTPQLGGDLDLNGHNIDPGSSDATISLADGKFLNLGTMKIMAPMDIVTNEVTAGVEYNYTITTPKTTPSTYIDYVFKSASGWRMGTLLVLCDGISVSVADMGTELNTPSIDFAASISGSDVIIVGTSMSVSAPDNLRITIRYMS